jgi:hypothetical protein
MLTMNASSKPLKFVATYKKTASAARVSTSGQTPAKQNMPGAREIAL